MARRTDVVLEEILRALDAAEDATAGLSRETFAANLFLQLGVERTLEIVSEAVRHLPEAMLADHPHIPWPDVRALGNLIRHEYWRVDPAIVWTIVADELPPLRAAIAAMLESLRR